MAGQWNARQQFGMAPRQALPKRRAYAAMPSAKASKASRQQQAQEAARRAPAI